MNFGFIIEEKEIYQFILLAPCLLVSLVSLLQREAFRPSYPDKTQLLAQWQCHCWPNCGKLIGLTYSFPADQRWSTIEMLFSLDKIGWANTGPTIDKLPPVWSTRAQQEQLTSVLEKYWWWRQINRKLLPQFCAIRIANQICYTIS